MATILYRALDINGDPTQGNGQGSFLTDLYAVAQAISTRLKLLMGEWWENLNTGTPLFQSMLGVSGAGKNTQAIALLITQRILGTPYVTGVTAVNASYDPNARAFSFSCQVETTFGTLTVTNVPTVSAGGAPQAITPPDLNAPTGLEIT